jgi:uncharacterized membrane protein YdjX (TVP38/TMEM64 family)
VVLALLTAGVVAVAVAADVETWLAAARAWIETLGPVGPVVFAGLYAVATVFAIPASVLTVAAGAMFGSVVGVAAVSAGSTLGAAASFAIARWIARDAIAARLANNARFAKLDASTARHGAIYVAITRLVPLFPFVLLNYGFGLTRVPFWTYLGWSWLCMLPATALYVVGGDALTQGLAEGRVPWPLIGAFVGLIAVVAVAVRLARRTLARREQQDS